MKKTIVTALILSLSINLAGCAGTHANPIPISQIGDDKMSCNSIKSEMEMMQQMVSQKNTDGNTQAAKNVAAVVTGAFLIFPLFFIDPHNNNSVEEQAAKNRYNKLHSIGKDKECF